MEFGENSSSVSPFKQALTDPAQQAQILERLSANRCALKLSLSNQEVVFASKVQSVNRKKHTLVISDPRPAINPRTLLNSPRVTITAQTRGTPILFSASVLKVFRKKRANYYVVTFPEKLYYGKKRAYYRTYIRMLQRPRIQMNVNEYSHFTGEVADISLGGVLAILPKDARIESGIDFANCNIMFGEDEQIAALTEIRHQSTHPKTGRVTTGLAFIDLSNAQQSLIQKNALQIERENVRFN